MLQVQVVIPMHMFGEILAGSHARTLRQVQCSKFSEAFLIHCVTRLVVFRRDKCMPGLDRSDTCVMFLAVL